MTAVRMEAIEVHYQVNFWCTVAHQCGCTCGWRVRSRIVELTPVTPVPYEYAVQRFTGIGGNDFSDNQRRKRDQPERQHSLAVHGRQYIAVSATDSGGCCLRTKGAGVHQ